MIGNAFKVKRIDGICTAIGQQKAEDSIDWHFNIIANLPKYSTFFFAITETVEITTWLQNVQNLIDKVRKHCKHITRIFVILDITYKPVADKIILNNINGMCLIDFDFVGLYYGNGKPTAEFNQTWQYDMQNFLFLVGKPAKSNRVTLLHCLDQYNVLDNGMFSFHANQEELNSCRHLLGSLSLEEQDRWFEKVNNTTLDFDFGQHPEYCIDRSGFGTAHLFDKALFNLVAETWFDRPYWSSMITEKTYKAILNQVPFIIAGELYTCKELQDRGFKTFNEYLAIPNYDNPDLPYFLQRKDGQMPLYHKEHFLQFYQSFKTTNWPECNTIEDLDKLPHAIKRECLASFKYPILDFGSMRLKAIAENVQDWLQNIYKYRAQIKIDIEHNFKAAQALDEVYSSEWKLFASQHNLPFTLKDLVFETYRYSRALETLMEETSYD